MKYLNRTIITLFLINALCVTQVVYALEFEKESDKASWIKEFFKDKNFEPITYPENATEEEKDFERQLLQDFVTQNGIEHIEPIAVGKSINDPEIAKYNTACPDKKPINLYRFWRSLGSVEQYPATEEELEDPENKFSYVIDEYKCTGNLKIYKFNVFNTSDNKQNFLLYCDNYIQIRDMGVVLDLLQKKEPVYCEGIYLNFDSSKCLYSKLIHFKVHTNWKNSLTGIFKYLDKTYLYTIETVPSLSKKEITYIKILNNQEFNNFKLYIYKTQEA